MSLPAEHFDICFILPDACGSVESNWLGPQGGVALAEGLKGNTTLKSLKCAAALVPAFVQRPVSWPNDAKTPMT